MRVSPFWRRLNQFARFLLVGAFNTSFSYGVYAAALWVGLHYVPANLLAMCLGTVLGFLSQGSLVFGSRDARRFGRFLVAWAAIWAVNATLIHLLVRWGELNAYLAGAIAMLPVVVLSFLVQKHFVFPPRDHSA